MSEARKITLPMPRLGETMEQGTIANWLIEPGTTFKRGDPLLELETDKTLVEYPALGSGTLVETQVGPGDIVDVGAPIAVIETEDAWEGVGSDEDEGPEDDSRSEAPPAAEPQTTSKPQAPSEPAGRARATPLARRLAKQGGLDINDLTGTGRRGRVEARDVEQALSNGDHSPSPSPPIISGDQTQLPVLFVHGFAGLGSNWAALRAGLQRSGVKSSAPDLPGHGGNDASADSVQDLVDWLSEALDRLEDPVHLVGHSLGAHVSSVAARAVSNRVARLTMVTPVGCGHEINGTFLTGMASASTAGEIRHFLRLLGPKASKLPDDAVASIADELGKGRLSALCADVARGDTQCTDTISVAADLAEHMPVSAVFGLADRIIPKEHMFNMPPLVTSHAVRTGHMPHWDAPGLMQKIITRPM